MPLWARALRRKYSLSRCHVGIPCLGSGIAVVFLERRLERPHSAPPSPLRVSRTSRQGFLLNRIAVDGWLGREGGRGRMLPVYLLLM